MKRRVEDTSTKDQWWKKVSEEVGWEETKITNEESRKATSGEDSWDKDSNI